MEQIFKGSPAREGFLAILASTYGPGPLMLYGPGALILYGPGPLMIWKNFLSQMLQDHIWNAHAPGAWSMCIQIWSWSFWLRIFFPIINGPGPYNINAPGPYNINGPGP